MSLARDVLPLMFLLCGQAFGQSVVTWTVELGGKNHAAVWEAGQFPAFTAGNPADSQTFNAGAILTWDARAVVSGIHQTTPAGGPGHNVAPNGAALLVFSLELHAGTVGGPLVQIGRAQVTGNVPTTAGWMSTINDGDADGTRGQQNGADPLLNAAFAMSFNINNAGPGAGTGRIIDPRTSGGPKLNIFDYPSANGWPVNSTAPLGKLLGMGAAYPQFDPTGSGSGPHTAGVGMAGLTGGGCTGLASPPIAEGQISTLGLTPGTYVLKLVPDAANILRGDFNCATQGPANFAVAANQVLGDDITFTLVAPPVGAPAVTSAVSRKTHGGAGTFDISMGLAPAAGEVECRLGGPTLIEIAFNADITPADGTLNAPGGGAEVTVSSNPAAAITVSNLALVDGNKLRFELSDVPARCCLSVLLSGIARDLGGGAPGAVMANTTLLQRVLLCDAVGTGNGLVESNDVSFTKARASLGTVDNASFRADYDIDGTISNSDVSRSKAAASLSQTELTCP